MRTPSATVAFLALLLTDVPVDRLEQAAEHILEVSDDQDEHNEGFDLQSALQVQIAEHLVGLLIRAEQNIIEYRNSKPQILGATGDPV